MDKLTNKDIKRIVENLMKEGMDNDEATHLYRRIQRNGEEIDSIITKFRGAKNELDDKIKTHIRRDTGGTIFDSNQRTPNDVLDSVANLNRVLNNLETLLNDYKNIIRKSIY
jgi:DNA gyrase/topoisomerase IV subunit A